MIPTILFPWQWRPKPEDVSEIVRLPEDAIVTVVVIANEADDSELAVADSDVVDLRLPRLYIEGLVFPKETT